MSAVDTGSITTPPPARSGEIARFTGVDAQYEPPVNPELAIDTAHCSVEAAVQGG